MFMLCLCPTYGRHPDLVSNAIECFNRQVYPADQRFLLVYDDAPTFKPRTEENWAILTGFEKRDVPSKYNYMMQLAQQVVPTWDAVVVWEDDDVYLPQHLSSHASKLATYEFSYPEYVLSTYGGLGREKTGGRFHASLAFRREVIEKVRWPDTKAGNFDQQLIKTLQEKHTRGAAYNATYCFRWGDTGHFHGQARMADNPETWSDDFPIQHKPPKGESWEVKPRLDKSAKEIYDTLGWL